MKHCYKLNYLAVNTHQAEMIRSFLDEEYYKPWKGKSLYPRSWKQQNIKYFYLKNYFNLSKLLQFWGLDKTIKNILHKNA